MSDYNDFEDENDDSTDEVAGAPEEEFSAFAQSVVEGIDPSNYITFTTTGGITKYVPVDGPTKLVDAFASSGINIGGAFKFFLNGAEVKFEDVIPTGSTVNILGQAVKGGVI
jgi:hypothetical protein